MEHKMTTKPRWGWRIGILFVAICILVGLMVGAVITRAQAMPAPCDSCHSVVKSKRMGVRKFKADMLGHVRKDIHYPRKAKRIILDKLMAYQAHHPNSTGRLNMAAAPGDPGQGLDWTRAQMWRNFVSHDNCIWEVNKSMPINAAAWTCRPGHYQKWIDQADNWTKRDVRGVICSGVVGIGVKGAFATGDATGPGAPWVWAGFGAAWTACMWQDKLEAMAG